MRTRALMSSLCLLTVVGCASGRSTTAVHPMDAPLCSDYKTVLVHVTSTVPESDADARALENEIITELRKNPRITTVVSATGAPDAKADLRLNATIVDLRKVSAGKRLMLGAFAGRGSVKVSADLLDGRDQAAHRACLAGAPLDDRRHALGGAGCAVSSIAGGWNLPEPAQPPGPRAGRAAARAPALH